MSEEKKQHYDPTGSYSDPKIYSVNQKNKAKYHLRKVLHKTPLPKLIYQGLLWLPRKLLSPLGHLLFSLIVESRLLHRSLSKKDIKNHYNIEHNIAQQGTDVEVKFVRIKSYDDTPLDAIVIQPDKFNPPKDQKIKTILYFPPNASCFQNRTLFKLLHDLAIENNAKVIMANYRGVRLGDKKNDQEFKEPLGHSDKLILDAHALTQYALDEEKATLDSMALRGHSLGGAVATLLKSEIDQNKPKGTPGPLLFSDRSFTHLTDVIMGFYFKLPKLLLPKMPNKNATTQEIAKFFLNSILRLPLIPIALVLYLLAPIVFIVVKLILTLTNNELNANWHYAFIPAEEKHSIAVKGDAIISEQASITNSFVVKWLGKKNKQENTTEPLPSQFHIPSKRINNKEVITGSYKHSAPPKVLKRSNKKSLLKLKSLEDLEKKEEVNAETVFKQFIKR